MKIAVTSQNFRTITGHAGKSRRFLIFTADGTGGVVESGRLDLPKELSLHEFRGLEHPLFSMQAIITGSCGEGFIRRLGAHGVQVIATSAEDPAQAAADFLAGRPLPAATPHDHTHEATATLPGTKTPP
jgi:predicted Fe-Mo cluster-binding NifX family protein